MSLNQQKTLDLHGPFSQSAGIYVVFEGRETRVDAPGAQRYSVPVGDTKVFINDTGNRPVDILNDPEGHIPLKMDEGAWLMPKNLRGKKILIDAQTLTPTVRDAELSSLEV